MSGPDASRDSVDSADDWERVLSAAAHLQVFVPDAVLVGGTASAIHAKHRFSHDDDHVVVNLVDRFQSVLEHLESQAGWTTNRLNPPVLILGNLYGVETGIRNLIREAPLETEMYETKDGGITLPTLHEMARIKAWLIVTRNATRDYIDFVALADKIEQRQGYEGVSTALQPMDKLYPQKSGMSVALQLAKQLSEPIPHDLGDGNLKAYRLISERWRNWQTVKSEAMRYAALIVLGCDRRSQAGRASDEPAGEQERR